jgi:hypothetical protein
MRVPELVRWRRRQRSIRYARVIEHLWWFAWSRIGRVLHANIITLVVAISSAAELCRVGETTSAYCVNSCSGECWEGVYVIAVLVIRRFAFAVRA